MTPELKPHPLNSPSVVLFLERSCGRWFPLAGTCEDSARSGPGGDPRSCRDTCRRRHTAQSGPAVSNALLRHSAANLDELRDAQTTVTRAGWTHWLVDELLQAGSSLLDEGVLEKALIAAEWQLSLQGFARQRWYYNLRDSETQIMRKTENTEDMYGELWFIWKICLEPHLFLELNIFPFIGTYAMYVFLI